MTLYKLIHLHDIDDYIVPDVKNLGFFSSMRNVEDAIAFFASLPGFCHYPNGFIVTEHSLEYARMSKTPYVYEVCISIHDKNWDYEYESAISMHATQKQAMAAKQTWMKLNKTNHAIYHSTLIKQIWIDKRRVDEKSLFWAEGFQ